MEIVMIDAFIVPQESRAAFLESASTAQSFIRTLPGFVEGFIHEQQGAESCYNFMTTAVWENEQALHHARSAVAIEFQKRGFDPQESMKQMKVERIRATYMRTQY